MNPSPTYGGLQVHSKLPGPGSSSHLAFKSHGSPGLPVQSISVSRVQNKVVSWWKLTITISFWFNVVVAMTLPVSISYHAWRVYIWSGLDVQYKDNMYSFIFCKVLQVFPTFLHQCTLRYFLKVHDDSSKIRTWWWTVSSVNAWLAGSGLVTSPGASVVYNECRPYIVYMQWCMMSCTLYT